MNPSPLPFNVYHPRNALLAAIKEWIPEFSKQKTVWGPMSKPQVVLTVTAAPLTPVQPMTVPVQQPVVLNKQPVPVALTSQLKETAVAAPGSNNNGALSNGESGLVSTTTAAAPSAIQLPQPMQPPGVPSAAPATCVMGPTGMSVRLVYEDLFC